MSIQPASSTAAQFVAPQTAAGRSAQGQPANAQAAEAATRPSPAEQAAQAAKAQEARELDPERLQEAVKQAQASLQAIARDITFSLNDKAGMVVVKVIERESKEVIRQIPSEEFLKIAEMLKENIDDIRAGLLVEQKA